MCIPQKLHEPMLFMTETQAQCHDTKEIKFIHQENRIGLDRIKSDHLGIDSDHKF